MKKVTITYNGCEEVTITAPADKEMVFDGAMLQHGILAIGEHGASGTKICSFKNWDRAFFLEDGENGYAILNTNPF